MIETNCNVPLPVTFNCWKHHAGYLKDQIKFLRREKTLKEELQKNLLIIGESQMDLYLGKLTPWEISDNIINNLKQQGAFDFEEYKKWLFQKGKKYKLMQLLDNSIWTLRLGKDINKYVHIHPGRNSPHTIRIKAITLKTAIAVLIMNSEGRTTDIDTALINEIRATFPNAPPIKKYFLNSAVARAIKLLS